MINQKPINQKGYVDSIVNIAEGEATYYLYAPIDDYAYDGVVTAKEFADWLNSLDPSIKTINIRINSPGGSVFAARAMEQHIREIINKTVNTYIDGVAASAATYIALAGHNVYISEGGFMMIHKANSFAMGNSSELIKVAALLDQIDTSLVNTYSKKTGIDSKELMSMLEAETWLNAEDAVALKFADIINTNAATTPKNQTVSWNFSEFKNAPESIKQKPTQAIDFSEDSTIESQAIVKDDKPEQPRADIAYLLRRIDVAQRSI